MPGISCFEKAFIKFFLQSLLNPSGHESDAFMIYRHTLGKFE